jgi:hypothetical protein
MMRLLLFLCVSLTTAAAVRTSSQSGNWADSSTWGGSAAPGNGDQAVIANTHTVTIAGGTSVVVGTSPATDDAAALAIACASDTGTGVLAIGAGATLVVRGRVHQCNSHWTVASGATIIHDSSQATTPASANYSWRIGMVNAQNGSKLILTGTAGSRITVGIAGTINADGSSPTVCASGGSCASGQAGGWQGGPSSGSDFGFVQCYYCDITNWGLSTSYLVRSYPFNGSTTDVRGVIFEYSTIGHSGPIHLNSASGSNTYFRLLNTVIYDPVTDSSGRSVAYGFGLGMSAAVNGGDRRIENCYIEGNVFLGFNSTTPANGGWVLRNSHLRGNAATNGIPLALGGRPQFSAGNFDLNWLENRNTGSSDSGHTPSGTVTRLVATRNAQVSGGPHWFFGISSNSTYDGWVADCDCNAIGAGDIWQIGPSSGNAAYTWTVKNGVATASNDGTALGIAINISGATNCNGITTFCPQITATQNTITTADVGAIGFGGEGSVGYAGEYPSVDSNIVWRSASGVGWVTKWDGTKTAVAGTYTTANYNWLWNVTGSGYYGYPTGNPTQYTNAPGANDQTGDPLFYERRRVMQFGLRFDPTISTLNALGDKFRAVYLDMALGTSNGDPRYNILDLYNWVRAGYRPRNKTVWTAGAGGIRSGGVAPMTRFGALAQ